MDQPDPTDLNFDHFKFWVDLLRSSGSENNYQVFEQSEFSFPNQVGAGTWEMNQTSPNQLHQAAFAQATTSNGVTNTMHFDPNHFQSVPPRPSNNGRKMPGTAQNKEKKKETDKAYRERLKEKQKKMEADISDLRNENEYLNKENTSLIEITSTTNKSSQSATAEKEKLENDISLLNGDIQTLQNCFDLYSKRLVNSNHVDHQAELIHLKNKISILRQNSNRNNWMTEKQELEDEIAKLEGQNKVLKVQVEVLSEMNINEDIEEKQA